MAPLIDRTVLDLPLLEAAKAIVAARRAKPVQAKKLSERAQAVKTFLGKHGKQFYRDGHTGSIHGLMSAVLGEDIGTSPDATGLIGRMVVITDEDGAFGHNHKDVVLFCPDGPLDHAGVSGREDVTADELPGRCRDATDKQVETFFKKLAAPEAMALARPHLMALVTEATKE